MVFITQTAGYVFLLVFGIAMIATTYFFAREKKFTTKESFLVANRNVGWLLGGTSIAASWIWAPALFVSVQLAYQQGIAGLFWFTLPNVIALGMFAIFGPHIREKLPKGYTLPQYIRETLGNKAHTIYLIPYFFYQLMAVTVQLFAGGSLVSLLTGIPLVRVMPLLAALVLAYTLISGMRATLVTDFIQMGLILTIGAILLPLTWVASGGLATIVSGIGGLANITNPFDPGVAFSFGIVTSIGLIAGALSDQQYWQRSFAIKKSDIRKAFLFGAALFALVPISLATLGFIATSLSISVPTGIDVSMIGVQTVATLLPSWAVLLFVIMLLAGLSSTLDSGLSAASSLWVTDVMKKQSNKDAVKSARRAMVGITTLGLLIALGVVYLPGFGLQHLWWIFNTIAACVLVPTLLALYWGKLSERGVIWGVLTAFIIGVPMFIYSNILGNTVWIVCSSLFVIAVSAGFCVMMPKTS